MDGDVLWEPTEAVVERSKMGRLRRQIERRHGIIFAGYPELWQWSVDNLEQFYAELVEFCDIRFTDRPREVLTTRRVPEAEWFPGGTLNYAEHLIRALPEDGVVVRGISETRDERTLTAGELRRDVGRIRAGLVKLGVGPGDRVAGYLPNIPEAVAAFLAVGSIGAIWVVCPPEFGLHSVVDRLGQVEPKVLLAVDGYRFAAKDFDKGAEVGSIRRALPTVEKLVWLPYLGVSEPPSDALLWDDAFAVDGEVTFTPVPFDRTLCILFTSGTTGLPKALPHTHGGMLVEHHKWLGLHIDSGPGDTFFWFSTTGWVVWYLVVSSLLTGAQTILMDGSPIHPGLEKQWEVIEKHRVTQFGVSSAYLLACQRAGMKPGEQFDLSSLRVTQVAGAPYPPRGWEWFYEAVGKNILLESPCGGTDVTGTFIGGAPMVPVLSGRQACVYLGVRVEAWNEQGEPVIGVPGELVLTTPIASMPKALWNDPGGERLNETYYSIFPDVWNQRDWVIFHENNSCSVVGRSDATLNRAGVRLGPSEYYATLDAMPEIQDALVVHVQRPEDDQGQLCLFVVLSEGCVLDDALRARINERLASTLSPRHVPDVLEAVSDVPKTLTGKKLEVPVRRILEGAAVEDVTSAGTLSNPESVGQYVHIAEAIK